MASSQTETPASAVAQDLQSLRDDIAKLNSALATLLRQQADAAGDHIRGAIDDAAEQLTASTNTAKARVQTATSDLEATITRNPISAVLLSMLVGLLLGLWSRQSR